MRVSHKDSCHLEAKQTDGLNRAFVLYAQRLITALLLLSMRIVSCKLGVLPGRCLEKSLYFFDTGGSDTWEITVLCEGGYP